VKLLLPFLVAGSALAATQFETTVKPVLSKNCSGCHNENLNSGGLDITPFTSASSLTQSREGWEVILKKLRSGEMPPKGMPRPPQPQMEALIQYLQGEFDKADRNVKPDPGRVTARRLNRAEYSNTIRDLLAVDFHAEKDFPTDDSGDGFDNMADILSVSPLLMEKYLTAAERIAARAVYADPLPKPVQAQYGPNQQNIRRVSVTEIEAKHRVDFDGDYTIVIGLPGTRGKGAEPVELGLWMDGRLLKKQLVETKPSDMVAFSPYSDTTMRLYLPEGEHSFRVGFIGDDFVTALPEKDYYDSKKNKWPNTILFSGPFPSTVEKASRKKLLICDPKSGDACVEKILSTVARKAYRRPVTKAEIATLMKFVAQAKADGQDNEHGIQLALEAILVSPNFLFRVEHDPRSEPRAQAGGLPEPHKLADLELASRLSYFLWSSMPDDELLNLAEASKLHDPVTLNAQVKRMMADPRSSALSENFAGQWLEIRNLDYVKPDPDKFLRWGPDLRDAMKTETQMFFDYILRQNRPLSEFLDAKYTFLNERLAGFYGIPGVTGSEFRKVDLTGDQRGGLLSQASVLTVSSYPSRTSVVIRGKYVLRNILGSPPAPPPPDVPALDEAAVGTSMSLRQQMEKHRDNAVCASCHTKMDPLGFGLENYDAIGRWRTRDGKFPVDSSGTLPNGKTFNTPAEMRAVLLSQLPDFSHCVIEKMLTYALGRGLQPYDRPAVNEISRKLEAQGYPFQTLIFEVVNSLPFQSRRGEALTTQNATKPKEIASR
jgi:mono/diheme cytochrome c family protein